MNRALTLRLEDLEHKYAVLLNMLHNQNKRFELQAKEDKSYGVIVCLYLLCVILLFQ